MHSRSVLEQRLQGAVGEEMLEASVMGSHLALATRQGSQACRWAGGVVLVVMMVVVAAAAVDGAGVGVEEEMGFVVVAVFVVEFGWLWSGGVDLEVDVADDGDDCCCAGFDWWL